MKSLNRVRCVLAQFPFQHKRVIQGYQQWPLVHYKVGCSGLKQQESYTVCMTPAGLFKTASNT